MLYLVHCLSGFDKIHIITFRRFMGMLVNVCKGICTCFPLIYLHVILRCIFVAVEQCLKWSVNMFIFCFFSQTGSDFGISYFESDVCLFNSCTYVFVSLNGACHFKSHKQTTELVFLYMYDIRVTIDHLRMWCQKIWFTGHRWHAP